MMAHWRKRLRISPITTAEYGAVIAADKVVYPTTRGLTPEILEKWYARYPQFGMIFTDSSSSTALANCLVVPLNVSGWQDLTEGKLSESELDADTLFDPSRDDGVGLHIYHMEKSPNYPPELPRFGLVAMEALRDVIASLPRPVRICGMSGLTVTKAGISLFTTLYGCRERSYVCKEHIMRTAGGALEVHEATSQDQLAALLSRGLEYVVRVRMLVLTPDDPSLVWSLLLPRGG